MQIYENLNELPSKREVKYAVTFGKFDGIHKGHQDLLQTLKTQAEIHNSQTFVISFLYANEGNSQKEHESVAWGVSRPYIRSRSERERILEILGVQNLLYLRFDEVRPLSYQEFLMKLLEQMQITVIVGSDKLAIGVGKQGTPEFLREFLKKKTSEVAPQQTVTTCFTSSLTVSACLNTHSPHLIVENSPLSESPHTKKLLSTTLIKEFLARGEVTLAAELMWLPFSLRGKIIEGRAKGRELGYPTANFFVKEPRISLKQATYLSFVWVNEQVFPALTFVGIPKIREDLSIAQVFQKKEPIIESFVFDFTDSIYNKEVEVYFLAFLRENISLDNYQDLQKHIESDEKQARTYFTRKSYQPLFQAIKEKIRKVHSL